MRKTSRMNAEEQFAAAQKKTAAVNEEKEREAHARAEQIAALRARRLAKEAQDEKDEKAKKDAKKPAKPRATKESRA